MAVCALHGMELSTAVIDGVQVAGSSFDENEFQKLVEYSMNSILEPVMPASSGGVQIVLYDYERSP